MSKALKSVLCSISFLQETNNAYIGHTEHQTTFDRLLFSFTYNDEVAMCDKKQYKYFPQPNQMSFTRFSRHHLYCIHSMTSRSVNLARIECVPISHNIHLRTCMQRSDLILTIWILRFCGFCDNLLISKTNRQRYYLIFLPYAVIGYSFEHSRSKYSQ